MKKLLAATTILGMLAVASPAFASTHNDNQAHVNNTTSATSISGDNGAFGGNGGHLGNAGSATNNGTIKTGDSNANAGTLNLVNTNVSSGSSYGYSFTSNDNQAHVKNTTEADAVSGGNGAVGGNGGHSGNAGNATNNGGIISGNSNANAASINVVNTNITVSHHH